MTNDFPVKRQGFTFWLLIVTAISASLFARLSHAEKLTIYADEWPPYNFVQNGELVGISTDIVKAAMDSAGIEYELKARPWARAYKTVQNIPNTALFTVQRSKKREHLFKWAGPIIDSSTNLFRLASRKDIDVSNFEELNNYRIGALNRGAVYQHLITEGLQQSQLHLHSQSQQLLDLLFAGRVDLIPGDEIDLTYQLNHHPTYNNSIEKAFTLYEGRYHIAFNNEVSDDLINKVQQALDQASQRGLSTTIVKRYLTVGTD